MRVCVHTHTCIHTHRKREIERERESVCVCVCGNAIRCREISARHDMKFGRHKRGHAKNVPSIVNKLVLIVPRESGVFIDPPPATLALSALTAALAL